MVQDVENFLVQFSGLIDDVKHNKSDFVSKQALKNEISDTCKVWLNKISNGLRTAENVIETEINDIDSVFEKALELSSASNRKTTYVNLFSSTHKRIQRNILIPLIRASRTTPPVWQGIATKISNVVSGEEKIYYDEASTAARAGCYKAAIVMAGCAFIDRLHNLVVKRGLSQFNRTSRQLKATRKGFYAKFNKEFSLKFENELQEIFDRDLVIVISAMVVLDLNQTREILHLLDTRNNCAHPSQYVADELVYANFLNEVYNLILNNPKIL